MRASRPVQWLRIWLPAVALLAVLVAANIAAYRHLGRIDLTSAGVYSLASESVGVARSIEQPVSVTWYHDLRNKSMTDAMASLRQYAGANSLISVQGRDPALHPADARRDGIQFAGSAIFESGPRRLVVHGGTETDFTNAFIRVSRAAVQEVCFTQGHREANPFSLVALDDLEEHDEDENLVARVEVHEQHGLGLARAALDTLGFKVRLLQSGQLAAQLKGCAVVIAAGPRVPFLADDAQALRDWTAAGGKTLVMLEPGHEHGLDVLLQDFGIAVHGGPVRDPYQHFRNDPETPAVSDYPRHRLTRELPLTFYPGVAALVPAASGLPHDVRVTPLVQSGSAARVRGQDEAPAVRSLLVLAQRDIDPSGAPAAGLKSASLMVSGDSDFATNRYFATMGNGTLFTRSIAFLAEQETLLDIQPRHYEAPQLTLTNRQMRAVFWLSTVLLPLAAIALGVAVWWRRR
nr:Gldg family protein [Pseudomonas sp.]